YSLVPETSASTNSATWAFQERFELYSKKNPAKASYSKTGNKKAAGVQRLLVKLGAQERTRTSTMLLAST
ncbi:MULTISPECIES: hypothetical protein, partial [unclassified Acidovorax]|uniref:hypothetical protein n=1 Tax=unclassified Acidovorax TaxID=2684926 RepID=UPI00197BECA9